MSKTRSSELKAHLGKYLRAVRAGREIVVTDRDVPIARMIPYRAEVAQGLQIVEPRDAAAPPLGKLTVRAVRVPGVDSTALLREDRTRR
ncbi:MAG: type II toxin-antitoxin system prevent-host-death family antitoxin [Myxococcales bacterium]|nr:type II toxin-antitoxin system prevent-host-death family antitoxin [Myxococcales bacterium]